MVKAKEVSEAITTEIYNKQVEARNEIKTLMDEKLQSLKEMPAFSQLPDNLRSQIETYFKVLADAAEKERYIGNLKAMTGKIEDFYQQSFDSINKWVEEEAKRQEEEKQKETSHDDEDKKKPAPHKVVKVVVQKERAMSIAFEKSMLETEEDVDHYLSALRQKMMGIIKENKNIKLN